MKNSKAVKWIGIVVGVLVLLGIGAAAGGTTDPTTTDEYKAVAAERDQARADLATAQADLATAQADLKTIAGDLPEREAALVEAKKDLSDREIKVEEDEQALRAAEKAVLKREKAVGIVEQEIASNTIPGEGVYRVGQDMKAGTYRSTDNADCYWMISSDANGSNIIDNNIVTGPALVTVRDGQFFTTHRCSDWVLQR